MMVALRLETKDHANQAGHSVVLLQFKEETLPNITIFLNFQKCRLFIAQKIQELVKKEHKLNTTITFQKVLELF